VQEIISPLVISEA